MSEDTRYLAYRIGAWTAWWLTFVLTWLRVADKFPREWSMLIILLIGVAIALGLALSRMRLARTITQVFLVGMQTQARVTAEAVLEELEQGREGYMRDTAEAVAIEMRKEGENASLD